MASTVVDDPSVRLAATDSPRTTAWGGALLVLAAALSFVPQFGFRLPSEFTAVLHAVWPAPLMISQLAFAVAAGLLALGVGGERGVVGASTAGRVALLAFGVLPFLNTVLGEVNFYVVPDRSWVLTSKVLLTVTLTALAAGIVAGLVVLRAGVLRGIPRWALLVVAAWEILSFAGQSLPTVLPELERERLVQSWYPDALMALIAAGVLLRLLWGAAYLLAARDARRRGSAAEPSPASVRVS